jgi:cell shape-determining protein MreD
MTARTVRGCSALAAGVLAQFLLEVVLPARLVPNVLLLSLIYLYHHNGYRWRVDGAFWAGLALGLMLRQPPGAYSLAALLALALSAGVRGALARRSPLSTLLEVLVASAAFDLLVVLLLARPVLVGLPAFVHPLLWRTAMTAAAYVMLSLAGGMAGLVARRAGGR